MSEGQYAVEAALEMELERDAYALWKLQQKETEQREKLKDAVLYFRRHCPARPGSPVACAQCKRE